MMKDERVSKLVNTLRGMSPERVGLLMVKSEWIRMRVTPADKEDMQRAAKACGMTLTEYLTTAHHVISSRLFGRKRLHPLEAKETDE